MSLKLGVVMDPIESINYKKDTTLALLWACLLYTSDAADE